MSQNYPKSHKKHMKIRPKTHHIQHGMQILMLKTSGKFVLQHQQQ